MNVKLLFVPQVLLIHLFFLQYFTCNSAKPDRETGKEGEQRKINETEIERNNRRKQWKTRQNQTTGATPTETKRKTSHGLCGESKWRTTRSTCKQINKEKKSTTSSKHIQNNSGYRCPETTGRHSNCIASMRLGEWMCVCMNMLGQRPSMSNSEQLKLRGMQPCTTGSAAPRAVPSTQRARPPDTTHHTHPPRA